MKTVEINFLDIEENKGYKEIINTVVKKCFEEENLQRKNLYINIILTNPKNIKKPQKCGYILLSFGLHLFLVSI